MDAADEMVTSSPAEAPILTGEEARMLTLLAKGMRETDVAGELAMSTSSLKRCLNAVVMKLGAGNRVEAIVLAVRRGLI